MKKLLYIIILFSISVHTYGQQWSFGLQLGVGLANMKLDDNVLNDQITIQEGRRFATGSFGIQGILRESRDQPTRYFKPTFALLVEASLCRCGGNVDVVTTLPSSRKSFSELNYVQWQGNFRAMGMMNLKSFHLIFGPNFSYNFYSGVYVDENDTPQDASNQFKSYALGYEAGIGTGSRKYMISFRYRGYFTDYGLKSDLFPTVYRNNQMRLVFSAFIFGKNIEKNRGSIFWRK